MVRGCYKNLFYIYISESYSSFPENGINLKKKRRVKLKGNWRKYALMHHHLIHHSENKVIRTTYY
jgi:hypothetical protein